MLLRERRTSGIAISSRSAGNLRRSGLGFDSSIARIVVGRDGRLAPGTPAHARSPPSGGEDRAPTLAPRWNDNLGHRVRVERIDHRQIHRAVRGSRRTGMANRRDTSPAVALR